MGIIATNNQGVLGLKGLHLYHGDISNCSMRVRMVLEEKELPWISHHLDLKKNETRTPAYFAINPYGLVPALVHDGVLLIESDDVSRDELGGRHRRTAQKLAIQNVRQTLDQLQEKEGQCWRRCEIDPGNRP